MALKINPMAFRYRSTPLMVGKLATPQLILAQKSGLNKQVAKEK